MALGGGAATPHPGIEYSGLHLDQCRAVSSAFHSAVPACSELWFAAAPAPTLLDKLRLTVVVSG